MSRPVKSLCFDGGQFADICEGVTKGEDARQAIGMWCSHSKSQTTTEHLKRLCDCAYGLCAVPGGVISGVGSHAKNSPVFQRGWQDLVIVEDIGATATSRSAAQGAACLFSTLIEAIPD